MIHLAFLWHFHQPSYLDLAARRLLMPWVRVHSAKDYTGMAMLLEEFPEIRCTANFSACLLDQVLAYGEGVEDEVLHLARKDPDLLGAEERKFLGRQLFYAHPQRHIAVHPRYAELQQRERSGAEFTRADWIDLVTLNGLVWLHPAVVEKDDAVQTLIEKGREYSISERDAVLARHLELTRGVIPRWKALRESGRVEISVSPYYHPIVPILCDGASSLQALPHVPPAPVGRELAPDAQAHVYRARARAGELFGGPPDGCWPSEGSVSPEACALLEAAGFRWFATDEEVLQSSVGGTHLAPWFVGGERLQGVFRDRALSNLLGFTYKTWSAADAVEDFLGRLEWFNGPDDRLVVVALDGENAWEHYENNGVEFFRRLYRRLSGHPKVRTVTVSEGIRRVPAAGRIERIWSGSWINRNFGVWMGHDEDRRAWDLVARVRRELSLVPDDDRDEGVHKAWECLYQAEGSDWYWWFGDDFSTPQDAEFDALFRRHLSNACRFAGIPEPPELARPIKQRRREDLYRRPWAVLDVRVDGRASDYFEWIAAGHYDLSLELGAMSGDLATFSDVFFGCAPGRAVLRMDFRRGVEPGPAMQGAEVLLCATAPQSRTVRLWPPEEGVQAALDDVLEASVPLPRLGAGEDQELEFTVQVRLAGRPALQIPSLSPLRMRTPARDQERIDWQV